MFENIRLSFQGIWSHKMRSFLTMLGIIIGIAAIIAIVSTIKGTNDQIKENLVGSGDNLVDVNLHTNEWQYMSGNDMTPEGVPMIDDLIKEEILAIDEVEAVSAYRYGYSMSGVRYKENLLDGAMIYGIDDDYFSVNGYIVNKGRLFGENDYENESKFVIIDTVAAKTLFGNENPISKSVEINSDVYVVVGVVEQVDTFQPVIEDVNDWYTYYYDDAAGKVFVPHTTWPLMFYFDEPYHVVVKAKSTDDMTNAGKKTAEILNSYITYVDMEGNQPYKYKSEDLLEKAKAMMDISASTSKQLIWIASISLLVGGIGVMNIMLVSVTERTKEIGLKKALGARKRAILAQFLTEAAVLTSLGGILGVGAGIGLAYLISDIAAVPVAISGVAIIISVAFSMVIGVLFGLLPSVKAANMNPIDALRHE
ncbi:MAG: ABC transporter permease [Lachnospiraceae bacterium]|nr:ABC transporter permease [Lachnospiraceae bacterium]